ncbi:MAG: TetR/AcrR family transcriptional regulator [Acidimicrobiales bacterium]
MTAVDAPTIAERVAAVPRPAPVMSRAAAARLTERQRDLLDGLTALIADGFAHLTMADIAAALECSLRTLYGIAASRDALVLVACDRNLWATGRRARQALESEATERSALEAVRRYLHAATHAVDRTTSRFAADLASVPGGLDLRRAHSEYLVAVTTALLDLAVDTGEMPAVDTPVVARAMADVADVFIRPEVIDTLPGTPKQAADLVVDLLLRGLGGSAQWEGAR